MSAFGLELTSHARGVILAVRAQPGARRDAVAGVHDGALRVAVTEAPERGRANEAIAGLLAQTLGCPKGQVTLLSGMASRRKRFLVEGLTVDDVRGRLEGIG
jgi:uncharacterized protein (TIGR00251 family)